MLIKRLYLFLCLAVAACGSLAPPCARKPQGDVVYITEQGWHAEIGIPVEELNSDLAFYRKIFPKAHVLMFGYGKKTFFTAPPKTIGEYILGPFPGPAAIQVVGLQVTPLEAYPPEDTVVLMLPSGGRQALSTYIWNDLAKDKTGKPIAVAESKNPDGLFYQAQSEYNLSHTCNTWTADALHDAGLDVSGIDVVFSGQVMSSVDQVAAMQCRALR